MTANEQEETEELKNLARRHLKTCELIYEVAIERGDIEIAARAVRSAMSVALNSFLHLGDKPSREIAIEWETRIPALYSGTVPTSEYLSNTIKWASGAMRLIFESDETPGTDQG